MARKMWDRQPDKAVYRVIITKTYSEDVHPFQAQELYVGSTAGRSFTSIYGPYGSKGAAKAIRTSRINQEMRTLAFRKGHVSVTGQIQRSVIKWETISDE